MLPCLAIAISPVGGPPRADDRSIELFRYHCSNQLGRRDVTLFANGTVRLRQGRWDDQHLYLDELLQEELASYVGRLRAIQASADPLQAELPGRGPEGDWVEDCEIELALPAGAPEKWEFSTYDVPPLVVAHLVQLAEDLASYTRPPVPPERVPADYTPRRGDVLRAADGGRFRVVAVTTDGLAVELEGLDAPLRIFVPVDEITASFSALEEPAER